MNPLSIEAEKEVRKTRPQRKAQIVKILGLGWATTRMIAQALGCYPSDLTRPVELLEAEGLIVPARTAPNPDTRKKANYWKLAAETPATKAADKDAGATATLVADPKDISHAARPQPTKKTRRRRAKKKGKE